MIKPFQILDFTNYSLSENNRNRLHELSELKGNPVTLLYSDRAKLKVFFENDSSPYIVKCLDNEEKPDCYVSSFTANLFFRTKKGMNYEKYVSLKTMLREIYKRAKKLELDMCGYKLELELA